MLAAFLSLPKQFITVYLGVALEDSEDGNARTDPERNSNVTVKSSRSIQYERYDHQGRGISSDRHHHLRRHVVHLPPHEQGETGCHLRQAQSKVRI